MATKMMTCPNCGAQMPVGGDCPTCGYHDGGAGAGSPTPFQDALRKEQTAKKKAPPRRKSKKGSRKPPMKGGY